MDRRVSRYVAYVTSGDREECCSEGHETGAEALNHAIEIRKRREGVNGESRGRRNERTH